MESPVNDAPTTDSDAHGRAALLLVESLIHGLTARGILSASEAVEIMELALDTQIAIADHDVQATSSMQKPTALLAAIVESMKIDLPDR